MEYSLKNLYRNAGYELLVLLLAPLIFSLVYFVRFAQPFTSVIAHLRLVISFVFLLYFARCLVARSIGNRRIYLTVSAIVFSSFHLLLLLYYLIIVTGLLHLNRVITWEIVTAYAGQIKSLIEVFDVVPINVFFVFAFVVLVCLGAWWYLINKSDWIWPVKLVKPKLTSLALIACVMLYCLVSIHKFLNGHFSIEKEPFSLTFYSSQARAAFQTSNVLISEVEKYQNEANETSRAYRPLEQIKKSNVVVFVVDALRPDHMSAYQYGRQTTPRIDKLIQTNGLYQARQMYSVCNESSCGCFALISSKYLHEFSPRPFTLQDALRQHGYKIRMILGGDHTNFFGLREMYGKVDDYFDGTYDSHYYMNDDNMLLNRVNQLPKWEGKPEYIHFHMMSSHGLGKKLMPGKGYERQVNYYGKHVNFNEMSSDSWDGISNFYDSGVWTADYYIEKILQELQSKSYLDDALVVITADHGELLGEKEQFAHSTTVFEPVLKIPFIMLKFSAEDTKKPITVIEKFQSQVDVAPTILQEMAMPIPTSWSGIPLQTNKSHEFIYFKSNIESGFFDLRKSEMPIKFWRNFKTQRQFAFKVKQDSKEESNVFDLIDWKTRREWMQHLPQ